MITHSLIIAVVESYAMVALQARLLASHLPSNWELILVDDGSVPQIPTPALALMNCMVLRTYEVRRPGEWTQKLAINKAVLLAHGEFIIKSDIDHVFTAGAIRAADQFAGDMMLFHRKAAVLRDDLSLYPLPDHNLTSPIDDIFVMRRRLFLDLGGYPQYLQRRYGGGGSPFWEYSRRPEAQPPADAIIYAVPEPFAEYHGLTRVPESVPL